MTDYSFRADQQADRDPEDSLQPDWLANDRCPVCSEPLMHKSIEEACPEVMYCKNGHVITIEEYEKHTIGKE